MDKTQETMYVAKKLRQYFRLGMLPDFESMIEFLRFYYLEQESVPVGLLTLALELERGGRK